MPEIPKSNIRLLDHVNAGAALSNHQLRYYGSDGTAEALGNFRKGLEQGISAGVREYHRQSSAEEEFRKKYQDTENQLAAAEARNLFSQINGDVDNRMTENPGSFNDFADWAKNADNRFGEQVKPFLERMTPEFKKQFEIELQGRRQAALQKRTHIGMQAKVSADYTRFQELFKQYAAADENTARKHLETFKDSGLISEQEYQTKLDVDLPRIFQSAQARRDIDVGKENVISDLEAIDSKGNYINYSAVTPEHRNTLLRYARAKDAQKRADENSRIYELLAGGMEYSREQVELDFEGRTSPEDLRQKQEQIQMIDRFESSKGRAKTAVQKRNYDEKLNSDLYDIINITLPANGDDAQKLYADKKRKILSEYTGDGSAVKTLLSQLDATFKAKREAAAGKAQATTSYKNSPEYKAALAQIDDAKKSGRLAAGEKAWYGVDDKEVDDAGTVTYLEKLLTIEVDNYISQNPIAKFPDIQKFIDERITYFNKTTVEQIANMAQRQHNTEGRTGTYQGKKVIFKNGKWEYAK